MYRPLLTADHLLLIDASAVIFRAYYGNSKHLQRPSDGLPIGAVFGTVQSLWAILSRPERFERVITHAAMIFDSPQPNHRHEIDPHYKAHRKAAPTELEPQRQLIWDATLAFGVTPIRKDGWEADDLIATYTRLAEDHGAYVTILSPDKDLMQLISPHVRLWDKGRPINVDDVKERFGVRPDQLLDYLSLVGDASDGIEGVEGIGQVKAAKLLNAFGTLENTPHAAAAAKAKSLIRLVENVSLPPVELLGYQATFAAAHAFAVSMEFQGVARWIEERL